MRELKYGFVVLVEINFMISPDDIKKSEARQILKLLEQWTRAEIMARLGPLTSLEFADHYQIKLEKADEIRMLIYDTSDLVELGNQWGLLRKQLKKKKKKKRKIR